ncbi:MAG: ribonuclease D [Prochlorococcus marinus CUG1439]|uniref:ribonuclease D n=1 Tax=Prochlorococcus sp. MIT 1314 TaxID=3096220 RepID=UPI001B1B9E59|nr:ribonuclease D [Prochlorococcus sp. MIT 1314]MCR8539154.1 ribonuclease D [Prochlorococcus marinus CUG1439]
MSSKNINIDFLYNDLNEDLYKLYRNSSYLAIDTEAMGLIHGRDRLCLVQICNEFKKTSCIKIELNTNSSPHLKALLENEKITKIFHYARFDLAALKCNLGINTKNIFCTKIASKLARTYTNKHGLKDLINELLGIELDKSAQSSDWGSNEDLTINQLDYAANDVRYLIEAMHKLKVILQRENRYELAKKCFKTVSVHADLDILRFSNIFEH